VRWIRVRFAGNRGGPRGPGAPRTGGPAKPVNIDVPAIPFDEVKKITNNFSGRELIGEGSYGRVYNATLSDGRAAVIKKLDTSASQDSDSDFAAQVRWSSVTFTLLALLSLRPTEINATVRCLPRTSP
jgi:hypothetical protein